MGEERVAALVHGDVPALLFDLAVSLGEHIDRRRRSAEGEIRVGLAKQSPQATFGRNGALSLLAQLFVKTERTLCVALIDRHSRFEIVPPEGALSNLNTLPVFGLARAPGEPRAIEPPAGRRAPD